MLADSTSTARGCSRCNWSRKRPRSAAPPLAVTVIGSETIASLAGLGHRIVNLAENMDMARMFAYIVFVVAIAGFLNAVVSRLEALVD